MSKWGTSLLAWFDEHRRPMPWRSRPTPYRVWVSEIMLQQTQVKTVIPYYQRFIRRFPSVRRLAASEQEDVLRLWEGLGYYARARNLHRAAQIVVSEHGAKLPSSAEEWASLPGVGRYTAAAIASISAGEVVPVVDGNVVRVFCRFWALRGNSKSSTMLRGLEERLAPFLPSDRPGDFNQAAMELGALICTPRAPRCDVCPLASECQARQQGLIDDLPERPAKKAVPHYTIAIGIVWQNGKVLVARRRDDQMLGGLWEFPGGKRQGREALRDTASREIMEETGVTVSVGDRMCKVQHAYSHFRITLHAYTCEYMTGRARPLSSDEVRWVRPTQLVDLPFPRANRRIIDLLLA